MFDALDEGFCILERAVTAIPGQLDFRYVAANAALETQSGVTNVVGRTMREVIPIEPEDWYEIFDQVLSTGQSRRFQQSLGSYNRELELYAFCVDPDTRDKLGIVFRDITAKVEAEARERKHLRQIAQVALTLQQAILGPAILPAPFAARYEPAVEQIGGDWYDVVTLSDGRYGVMVGDVVGSGLEAAAVMGQLRSAARALLLEDHGPGHVLTSLDTFAGLLPGALATTVFCAVIDPATGHLEYSSAGHPPAIIADCSHRHLFLDQAVAPPLAAVASVKRPSGTATLPPGSTLLLYTDGVIERRTEDIDIGLARAADSLARCRGLAPVDIIEQLTIDLLAKGHEDDAAILVYKQGG
jgi:serine phosphatase RsbU (regulator of sigma subunit)